MLKGLMFWYELSGEQDNKNLVLGSVNLYTFHILINLLFFDLNIWQRCPSLSAKLLLFHYLYKHCSIPRYILLVNENKEYVMRQFD